MTSMPPRYCPNDYPAGRACLEIGALRSGGACSKPPLRKLGR